MQLGVIKRSRGALVATVCGRKTLSEGEKRAAISATVQVVKAPNDAARRDETSGTEFLVAQTQLHRDVLLKVLKYYGKKYMRLAASSFLHEPFQTMPTSTHPIFRSRLFFYIFLLFLAESKVFSPALLSASALFSLLRFGCEWSGREKSEMQLK